MTKFYGLAARLLNKQILILATDDLGRRKKIERNSWFQFVIIIVSRDCVEGIFPGFIFDINDHACLRLRASRSFDLHILERDSGLNIKI